MDTSVMDWINCLERRIKALEKRVKELETENARSDTDSGTDICSGDSHGQSEL